MGRTLEVSAINEISSNKLIVANDMSGQRVLIKWQTIQAGNKMYEATLYNDAGKPVAGITLSANQPAYISMKSMQTGIYTVMLKQDSQLITREKVLWFK